MDSNLNIVFIYQLTETDAQKKARENKEAKLQEQEAARRRQEQRENDIKGMLDCNFILSSPWTLLSKPIYAYITTSDISVSETMRA